MQKIFVFLLLILACSFNHRLCAQEIVLNLDEAVALALRQNPDILLKGEDIEKARFKTAESESSLYPRLDFTSGWTNTRALYLKNITAISTQTTLKQYLYKGGKTLNSIARDKYKVEVLNALLDSAKLEIVLNVKKALYTLLLAFDFSDLNKLSFENAKGKFKFALSRYKHGELSASDVLNAQVTASRAKQIYEESLNQVSSARVLLNDLLYLDKDVLIKPALEFAYELKDISLDSAFLRAMRLRPEIRQLEAQENADKKEIEVLKSDSRPNIYGSLDYFSRSTASLTFSPSKGWQDYYTLGLVFSWPVFDGFAAKRRVEQAMIDLKQTRLFKDKTTRDIISEVKNAYLDLRDAIEKIEAVEPELEFYAQFLSSMKQKYERGVVSSLEMADADLKYQISVFNKKQAIYDYIVAKDTFEKAAGGI